MTYNIHYMNARQISYFKRAVVALFLLTGLSSQFQVVFACDLMDRQPQPVCCCGEEMSDGCEMGGGCGLDEKHQLNSDCCEVSVDDLSDISLGGPTSTASQVVLQNAPQPPPLALRTAVSNPQFKFGGAFLPFYSTTNRHLAGTEIYLVTQRFRI